MQQIVSNDYNKNNVHLQKGLWWIVFSVLSARKKSDSLVQWTYRQIFNNDHHLEVCIYLIQSDDTNVDH